MKNLFVFLVLTPLLISCANLKVTRNDSPAAGGESKEIKMTYIVWGFVPIQKIPPASSLCAKGRFETVDFGRTTGDAALTWLTLGFYVPQRATVYCAK